MGQNNLRDRITRRIHLRGSLEEGSIKNRFFYGEMEVLRVREDQNPLKKYIIPLIGRNDVEILESEEYMKIKEFIQRSPKEASKHLEDIRAETAEAAETIQRILRKIAHSEDEVLRTFAFREL
ncbi:MAG: hypothetical protein ACTSVF_00470 [Candidatus Asgardarchaeia archaeon]